MIFLHQGIITVGIVLQLLQHSASKLLEQWSCAARYILIRKCAPIKKENWNAALHLQARCLNHASLLLLFCRITQWLKKSYKSTQSLFLMSRIQITVRHLWKKKKGSPVSQCTNVYAAMETVLALAQDFSMIFNQMWCGAELPERNHVLGLPSLSAQMMSASSGYRFIVRWPIIDKSSK